jgi:hypothetical protein
MLDFETVNEKIEAEIALGDAEYEANPDVGEPMEAVFAEARQRIMTKYFMKKAV